ncbi:hypothetical protein EMIT0232MI5_130087 [Pseudomonas sp. IT-232MI5]
MAGGNLNEKVTKWGAKWGQIYFHTALIL